MLKNSILNLPDPKLGYLTLATLFATIKFICLALVLAFVLLAPLAKLLVPRRA